MNLRLFIAIELGNEQKKEIALIQDRLKRELPEVRWVKPQLMHLTLKFLGHVPEGDIPRIKEIITLSAGECSPFRMVLRGIGAFPGIANPRVIWIGALEETGALARLAANIDTLLADLDIEREERSFSPHLTLGRVKEKTGRHFFESVLSRFKDETAGEMTVAEISLIRSDLTPQGPVYNPLHCVKLV